MSRAAPTLLFAPARAAALAAIGRAVDEGGDLDTAYRALAHVDPILRPRARRLARIAYADALLATQLRRGAEGALHALRIAFLTVAGRPPEDAVVDDPEAVAAAFAALRPTIAAPRFWWASALAAIAILASIGLTIATLRGHGGAWPASNERGGPPATGVFATGGAPGVSDPALTQLFERDLPAFLIELDRLADARRRGAAGAQIAEREASVFAARSQALAQPALVALGGGGARSLEALLDVARAEAVDVGPSKPGDEDGGLVSAVAALDDELAGRGVGYYVDGDVITDLASGRRTVMLYAFTVARVTMFDAAGSVVRALALRRLDHLNWTQTLLGFSRPGLRDALVLLDQVDEELLGTVLPGLGPDAKVALFDDGDDVRSGADALAAKPETRAAVEARAGAIVRSEYGATTGLDAARAARLGQLLGARTARFDAWQKRLAGQGIGVSRPDKLRLDDGWRRSLAQVIPADELDALAAIDDELGDPAFATTFAALRDVLVSSVERHEVQHRIDYSRATPLPLPAALEALTGPASSGETENRLATRAKTELSAYAAELARDTRTTRVGLTMIARFLFDRRLQGSAECYAAVVIFEGLATELGVDAGGSLVARGAIDQGRAATVYLAITDRAPAAIREAAKRQWEKLFGGALPELRRVGAP